MEAVRVVRMMQFSISIKFKTALSNDDTKCRLEQKRQSSVNANERGELTQLFVSSNSSRKPFKLNGILVPYNLAMAALNFFIFYRLAAASLRLNYSIFCQPCRQIASDDEMQVSRLVMLLM